MAGIKFSGSPKVHGKKKQIIINKEIIKKNPNNLLMKNRDENKFYQNFY